MIETISISDECLSCLQDPEAFPFVLQTRLSAHHFNAINSKHRKIDTARYARNVNKIVVDAVKASSPRVAHLIDTRVTWSLQEHAISSIHIHLSKEYRHPQAVTEYSTTKH